MKGNLTYPVVAACAVVAVLLDVLPYCGHAYWAGIADFTFLLLLTVSFYRPELGTVVVAILCGLFMDAISPAPVHTVLFTGAYYIARLMERMFYNPGSPVHIMSFMPVILLETVVMFLASGGMLHAMGIPFLRILAACLVNCLIFVALLILFRKRDKAVMFKMR